LTGQPKQLPALVNLQAVLVGRKLLDGCVEPSLLRLLNLRHASIVDGDVHHSITQRSDGLPNNFQPFWLFGRLVFRVLFHTVLFVYFTSRQSQSIELVDYCNNFF
jgi:hypothetical protein